ncbi:hypothetical protein [Pseudoalteromonas sp. S1727]|uniref:hypothetical protein n=1 Tax=Pseudoalteromonas sp. S1727 TaxID=2066514 RepID=UPI001107F9EF|nr:hypothetical protein [Pseudoalteromonas sp. S1727]
MEINFIEILKTTAKKSPLPTLGLGLFFSITKLILEKANNTWLDDIGYMLIVVLAFILAISVVFVSELRQQNKEQLSKNRPSEKKLDVTRNEIEDIDTGGGTALIGTDDSSIDQIIIEENKIKKIKTKGAPFNVGKVTKASGNE